MKRFKMDKIKQEICPSCNGKKEVPVKNKFGNGMTTCWHCKGTGSIPKSEIISGLLFEAMIHDSVNLRQKLLWTETYDDLIAAGEKQINSFQESIDDGSEEGFIIDEYKGHLENFREWFEVFKMDLQVVKLLRQESYGFQTNYMVDRKKGEK